MAVNAGERNIADTPSNRMFYAVDKAMLLSAHTMKICANEKIFPTQYSAFTEKIVASALSIYQNAWKANNIMVKTADDWTLRRQYQKLSAAECNSLLSMIDLAKKVYHLRNKKVKYWAQMVIETRTLLRKWHEADQERYGKLLND